MMEITANAIQLVNIGENVQFTDTVVPSKGCVAHRPGSGLITLRGITNQCRARFKVSFGANIAVPTGGTPDAISLALSISGEPIDTTTMIVTPAAVDEYFNVFSSIYLDVPRGCCYTVSIRNTSDQEINVQNANLIVERIA